MTILKFSLKTLCALSLLGGMSITAFASGISLGSIYDEAYFNSVYEVHNYTNQTFTMSIVTWNGSGGGADSPKPSPATIAANSYHEFLENDNLHIWSDHYKNDGGHYDHPDACATFSTGDFHGAYDSEFGMHFNSGTDYDWLDSVDVYPTYGVDNSPTSHTANCFGDAAPTIPRTGNVPQVANNSMYNNQTSIPADSGTTNKEFVTAFYNNSSEPNSVNYDYATINVVPYFSKSGSEPDSNQPSHGNGWSMHIYYHTFTYIVCINPEHAKSTPCNYVTSTN